MPMSAAAMSGIEDWGLSWRGQIAIDAQTQRLADEESLVVGDCASIRDRIVKVVRTYAANLGHHRELDWASDLAAALIKNADDLGECEDDPDDLRLGLNELFDTLDYYRVCVVR